MLSKEDFRVFLMDFAAMEVVKSFNDLSPTVFTYEMYVNIQEKTLTQNVIVTLVDETHVMAYSTIGPCPNDAATLQSILAENMDGCHSRLAVFDGDLVQVYRYPIEFLESWELFKALDEVSQLANYAYRCYYRGANQAG